VKRAIRLPKSPRNACINPFYIYLVSEFLFRLEVISMTAANYAVSRSYIKNK